MNYGYILLIINIICDNIIIITTESTDNKQRTKNYESKSYLRALSELSMLSARPYRMVRSGG